MSDSIPAYVSPKFDPSLPVGVAGDTLPDGSQQVILNDNGKVLYGPNMTIVLAGGALKVLVEPS